MTSKKIEKRILVAGGAGFIGSHLCEALLKKKYQVFCVDNLLTGNKKNIESLLADDNFKFLQWDVTQIPPQEIINERFYAIFHLASAASPNPESPLSYLKYPSETLLANSLGTYNLLKIANEDCAKFLFASTSEIYGDPQVSPQPENYWGNVNPCGIRACYDEAKRFGEAMVGVFNREFKVDTRVARIFNTYGPKMDKNDGRVIVNFINQALSGKPITIYGKGKQSRSFCYINDTIDGLMKLMFNSKTKGEILNIGNDEEYTILQLANIILDLINEDLKIVFKPLPEDDPSNRCPDISKAKKLLDWKIKIPLKEGLIKTIKYYIEEE